MRANHPRYASLAMVTALCPSIAISNTFTLLALKEFARACIAMRRRR